MLDGFERELAELILSSLNLTVDVNTIDPEAPIFGGKGLDLDSIDALEIALLLTTTYGVTIVQGDERNKEYFSSVRSLAAFVSANRAPPATQNLAGATIG